MKPGLYVDISESEPLGYQLRNMGHIKYMASQYNVLMHVHTHACRQKNAVILDSFIAASCL